MKTSLNSPRITTVLYLSLFCTLLLASCENREENKIMTKGDGIAYVYPIDEITLDGNLADWPEDLERYPIKNAELGDTPDGIEDFDGHFRIGYSTDQNAVYIAMEITDQSLVIDTTGNSNWDTQDGLELYLNQKNEWAGSPITQYSEYGENRHTFGEKDSWKNIEMKKQATDKGKTVEWKISLDQKIKTGSSLGLDLVAIDKDDDSFTWISWSKGTQKVANPNRCGNVLFVSPGTEFGQLSGKADLADLMPKPFPLTARVSQIGNPKMWVRTSIDSLGNFSATLPVGEYQIDIPNRLTEIEYRFHRISPIEPIVFSLKKEGHDPLPLLKPTLRPKPYALPEKGLLHDFGTEGKKQVDKFVEAYQKFYNIPGVSLALIKDGTVVYHKTYGVKNTNTKEPINEKTLFEAASITKPVFAFVVLRLADKGIIDLDKPLHQYLPFEALEAYPEYKKMTGRHVLIHR
ncbi:MAG: serine hydrolase, partial [Aurantibacter sp.]